MLSLDQALNIISDVSPLGIEKVELTDALNRILCEDVYSDVNMPPFNKSAMDGYACRMEDFKEDLTVIETIPAGSFSDLEIGPNQCAKIMTGAPVPAGADCVVMVEHTEELNDGRIRFLKEKSKSNICYIGEDVKKGQQVLQKGIQIKSRHIPMLASVGYTEVPVFKLPKVAILATGSELVEPDENPGKAKIRNSNAYQLIAMLKEMGVESNYYGIVNDEELSIEATLKKAFEENDTVLLTGGVSVGDFDLVPHIIKKLGLNIHFNYLSIKPGKPVMFASLNNKLCFGLSGNPVSSYFQFELLSKPAIFKQMGFDYHPQMIEFELTEDIKRKKADRQGFYPVEYVNSQQVKPVDFHGSAHIHALSHSFGIVSLSPGEFEVNRGEKVNVRQI